MAVWLERTQAGDTLAMCQLGYAYTVRSKFDRAEQWLQRSADGGDILGMYFLAYLFRTQLRLDDAEVWYQHAADAGNVGAMVNLGHMLTGYGASRTLRGRFVKAPTPAPQNRCSAWPRRWPYNIASPESEHRVQRAADDGNPEAMFAVSKVRRSHSDHVGAMRWCRNSRRDPSYRGDEGIGRLPDDEQRSRRGLPLVSPSGGSRPPPRCTQSWHSAVDQVIPAALAHLNIFDALCRSMDHVDATTGTSKSSSIGLREGGPVPVRRCSCSVADMEPANLFPSSSTATNHGTVKLSASLSSHCQLGAPVMSMNVCTQSMEQEDQIVARINFACGVRKGSRRSRTCPVDSSINAESNVTSSIRSSRNDSSVSSWIEPRSTSWKMNRRLTC